MSNQTKTFGTLALVFGIVSLVLFCIPLFSVFIATLGVIFGIVAIIGATKENQDKGMSIAGIIISIFGLLIGIGVNVFIFGDLKNKTEDFFNKFSNNFYDDSLYNDDYYSDSLFDDIPDIDTNLTDVDSLLMNGDEINDLNNSNNDFDNGPGNPPE